MGGGGRRGRRDGWEEARVGRGEFLLVGAGVGKRVGGLGRELGLVELTAGCGRDESVKEERGGSGGGKKREKHRYR